MKVSLDKPILFDNMVDVTPSDSALLANPGYVFHTDSTDKAICFLTVGGHKHTVSLSPKEVLYVRVKQVYSTGTTATAGTVKLYYETEE